MLSTYHLIYLLSNTFGTYILFKFMCIFFQRREVNKKTEWISYIIYFFAVGIIFIIFNSPIVTIIFNLIALYLLTLNYRAKIKKRITAVIFVYSLLCTIEAVTALLTIYIGLENYIKQAEMIYIIKFLVMRILSFIVVLALSKYKMIKEEIELPLLHWISIIIIPTAALFLTIVLLFNISNDNYFLIVISMIILFLISIFTLYLYDALLKTYQHKFAKELLQQNNQ